jgi:hypothetical protein
VRSLALVDSGLDGYAWSPAWRDAFRADTWRTQLFATRPELAPRVDAMLARWIRPSGRNQATPLAPRAATRLGTIRVPTLVVVGERDLPDFLLIARTLSAGDRGRPPGDACGRRAPGAARGAPIGRRIDRRERGGLTGAEPLPRIAGQRRAHA